jgi:phosphate-selective porin OprO/OprP
LPAFRTTAAQTWFRYRADGTLDGTSLADGSRVRGSLQAMWHYARTGVLAEWTRTSERVRRGDASDTVDSRAWVTVASFVLTGEAATPRGVTPRHEFDPGSGGWGAVELTARLSQLSLDQAVFPTFADPTTAARVLREWAIGVNWYLNAGVKITSSFHRSTFTGGAPAGGNRLPENLLLSRLQFVF